MSINFNNVSSGLLFIVAIFNVIYFMPVGYKVLLPREPTIENDGICLVGVANNKRSDGSRKII